MWRLPELTYYNMFSHNFNTIALVKWMGLKFHLTGGPHWKFTFKVDTFFYLVNMIL